ncbi:MAG TPA: 50S ribosomal protein L11 methyltransferase [Rhizobiaceae bacterium]|nr:50S ribosomal protein L11 methyltransferase [Rhizobiaceae bacterium]
MTQTRLHVLLPKPQAEALFAEIDRAFEEDGLPLSCIETVDGSDMFEVSAYVDGEPLVARARFEAALAELGLEADIAEEKLPDIDWVAKSLEDLPPVRVGRFVVHGAHDRDAVRASDIGIEIEAAQAFGTGHHGTTAGCLDMLARICRVRRPRSALDLGAGSAVLAIGLAKAARVPVLATDIDPLAVDVARGNVAANRVSSLVEVIVAAGFDHPALRGVDRFDLIVANILAGPLMRLAPMFARKLERGGELVLSGILATQRASVLAAIRNQGLVHRQTLRRGAWVTLRLGFGPATRRAR